MKPALEAQSVCQMWRATGDPLQDLPRWVGEELDRGARCSSATVPVAELRGAALEEASFRAWSSTLAGLAGAPSRVWAFLPGIVDADENGLNRYMRFNIARSRAYRECASGIATMPAGTCTGHFGAELVVHALAMPQSHTAVENPRQRAAWAYSARFGPVAPPFARAARTPKLLMASGTASVIGEESRHSGDLRAQWDETMQNLQALHAAGRARGDWRSAHVYVSRADDLDAVVRLCAQQGTLGVERVSHAPLCRSELLVEVECVADA